MRPDPAPIRSLGVADVDDVVAAVSDAFASYPVIRYVLADAGSSYEDRLPLLCRLFVMARVLRGEPLLGIGAPGALAAVALLSEPGRVTPPEFEPLRHSVWATLGRAAEARYEAFGAATRAFDFPMPHLHLNVLAVRRAAQGRGLGRRLIEEVQQLSRGQAGSHGVSLTTELPANVALYEHCGYRVVGRAVVAPELETWGLFRTNP